MSPRAAVAAAAAGSPMAAGGQQTAATGLAVSPPPPVWTTNIEGTNIVVCGTNRLGNYVCFTNPPASVYRTNIALAWTQPGWPAAAPFTNHVLWTTNGANGPWTGDIPVACSNSNMVISVNLDPRVKFLFFKMGTNSF